MGCKCGKTPGPKKSRITLSNKKVCPSCRGLMIKQSKMWRCSKCGKAIPNV